MIKSRKKSQSEPHRPSHDHHQYLLDVGLYMLGLCETIRSDKFACANIILVIFN